VELKWLEDFITLAKLGNFSSAAEMRNVTQPAFSRRIQALESWLGTDLFDRSTTPITLTEGGKLFLPHATQIASGIYSVRHEFSGIASRAERTLRIITLHTLANHFIPNLISMTRAYELPINFQITPDVRGIENHIVQLLSDDVDILITYDRLDMPQLSSHKGTVQKILLAQEVIVPVIHRDLFHSLEKNFAGEVSEPIPYLLYSGDSFSQSLLRPIIEKLSWRLEPVYENSLGEGLLNMALLQGGLAWVPQSLAQDGIESGVLKKVGDQSAEARIGIFAYCRQSTFTPAQSQFWDRMHAGAPFDFTQNDEISAPVSD